MLRPKPEPEPALEREPAIDTPTPDDRRASPAADEPGSSRLWGVDEPGANAARRNQEEEWARCFGIEYRKGVMPLVEEGHLCPDDVARAALFLASDQSAGITGTLLYVDGGESLIQ